MSVLQTIPTANISWDDVRDTLNSHQGNVTNEFKTAFISNAKVNWRARFKPIIKSNVNFHTPGSTSENFWVADNGWCGVKVPVIYNIKDVKDKDFTSLWEWDAPGDTTGSPLRMDDFGGYNPYARSFVNTFYKGDSGDQVFYIQDVDQQMVLVKFFLNDNRIGGSNQSSLDLTDFAFRPSFSRIENAYFGLIISKKSSDFYSWITLDNTLKEYINAGPNTPNLYPYAGAGGLGLTLDLRPDSFEIHNPNISSGFTFGGSGEYDIYAAMFMDRNNRTNGIIRGSSSGYSLPNGIIPLPISPITVNLVVKSSLVSFSAISAKITGSAQNLGGGYVYITFRIYNNSNESQVLLQGDTVNNYYKVGVRRYWNDGSHSSNSYVYETQPSSAPITIPAKSSVLIENFYIGWVAGAYDATITEESGYTREDNCKLEIDFGGYWGGAKLSGGGFLDRQYITL